MISNFTSLSGKYSSSLLPFFFFFPDKKDKSFGGRGEVWAYKNKGKSLTRKVHYLFAKKLEIEQPFLAVSEVLVSPWGT